MTAEPRMEDLLASIRRAIQDDIGDLPLAAPGREAARRPRPVERGGRVSEDLSAAANDIKQLRERLARPVTPGARDRAQSVAEAIQAAVPRRSWRDAEVGAPASRMRTSLPGQEFNGKAAAKAEPDRKRAEEQGLLSEQSIQSVQNSLGHLIVSQALRPVDEQAIEAMSRDLLRGMLKQWLDENLPGLVERLVREEIERVARSGR